MPKLARSSDAPPLVELPTRRRDLRSMGFHELVEALARIGQPAYRARQAWKWIHARGARSLDDMSDLPLALRQKLASEFTLASFETARVERARDGTRKYAFRTAHGDVVESVFIPDASAVGRNTICISSQVGCGMGCEFCLTASFGFRRNLSAGEIVEQVTRVKRELEKERTPGNDEDPLRRGNIVVMGMGEPLANYRALVDALRIISSDDGHGISPRRITVSTVGLAPEIPRLGYDTKVNLAVSLNATTDAVRDRIMPVNRRYPIGALLEACRAFPLPERRRITIEYVLLAGENDTPDDAARLIRLLRGLRVKVNLIPFNEHPKSPYARPRPETIEVFRRILEDAHMTVLVRAARGDEISAACGQLGLEIDRPEGG